MEPLPPPKILCRPDALHLMVTGRLRLRGTRQNDLRLHAALGSDADAQRWLGWKAEDVVALDERMLADPLGAADVALPLTVGFFAFIGADPVSGQALASVSLTRQRDRYEVGGYVHPAYRGRGLGAEALLAVLDLAHRHLGIARIHAGCETDNHASRRRLTGAGFVPVPGPATHTLPNGRVIDSLWWEHFDPMAVPRCRHLPNVGSTWNSRVIAAGRGLARALRPR